MKNKKRHIPYSKNSHKFDVPLCYTNNPDALEKRAKKEDIRKEKEEIEFVKWYKDELQKYGYNFDEITASVKKKNKKRKSR